MAVPDFQTLMLPLLKLASGGQRHTLAEAVEQLALEFQLSDEDRTQLLGSGQTRLYNRVGWTTTYLKKAGLLQAVGPGCF
jgi:restriction system protein